jgi:hypothetical protein
MFITWVPLVLFSLLSGFAVGENTAIPLFHDPEVHARFLFVLPLLEFTNIIVAVSLAAQARQFLVTGIIPEEESANFRKAQQDILQKRDSIVAEVMIAVLAYSISVILRLFLGLSAGDSSWERAEGNITLAGWWYMLVSLPLLYFLLLRWAWIFFLWAWFLFRVSRLNLKLTATHPDRAGGLGFIGWGLATFSSVLMAISAVFSAGLADEILHHGESLDSLKYHIVVYVVVVIAIFHAPSFAFAGQLSRSRFRGLLDFGALIWRHDRAFEETWLGNVSSENGVSQENGKSILGSPDVSSLSDIAACYEHIDQMWLFPFDKKAFAVLVMSALLPMLPLVATAIPLKDILMKLGSFLI